MNELLNYSKSMFPEDDILYEDIKNAYAKGNGIYIPYNVPALKNSKVIKQMYTGKSMCCNAPYIKKGKGIFVCTKCNNFTRLGTRPIITKSDAVAEFNEKAAEILLINRPKFKKLIHGINPPYHLAFYFIRNTKHEFDFDNAITTMLDLLVKMDYLKDDNANHVYTYPLGYKYNSEKAGVIMLLIEKPQFKFYETKNT